MDFRLIRKKKEPDPNYEPSYAELLRKRDKHAPKEVEAAYAKLPPALQELARDAEVVAKAYDGLAEEGAHRCKLPEVSKEQAQEREYGHPGQGVEWTCPSCKKKWYYHWTQKAWHPK